jgi:p-hydroxybenzoate 3-monooxygenase
MTRDRCRFVPGPASRLDRDSAALARVWKAGRFSCWFTGLTDQFPQIEGFDRRLQSAELADLRGSRQAQAVFAENYLGLPLE